LIEFIIEIIHVIFKKEIFLIKTINLLIVLKKVGAGILLRLLIFSEKISSVFIKN